jgi:hypothetical protein
MIKPLQINHLNGKIEKKEGNMKTQVFTAYYSHDLEIAIESFLNNHEIKELIDIKFAVCDVKGYCCLILYKI